MHVLISGTTSLVQRKWSQHVTEQAVNDKKAKWNKEPSSKKRSLSIPPDQARVNNFLVKWSYRFTSESVKSCNLNPVCNFIWFQNVGWYFKINSGFFLIMFKSRMIPGTGKENKGFWVFSRINEQSWPLCETLPHQSYLCAHLLLLIFHNILDTMY